MPLPDDPARLSVLLADYEQAREEERHYASQQTTLIAITLTAVTLAAAVGFSSGNGDIKVQSEWRDAVLFVTPLLAVVPLLFLVQIGTTAVWRSYYIRALERELRSELKVSTMASYSQLPALSYGEIYVAQSAGRGSGSPGVLKALVSVTYPIIVLVVGGLSVAMAAQIEFVSLRLLMLLIYGGGAVILIVHVARVHVRGRAVFLGHVDVLRDRLTRGLEPSVPAAQRARSTLSYFTVPRPDELASKSPFLFLGVLAALPQIPALPWPSVHDLLALVVLWVAVEFLIYQARYQWNDILGMREDELASASIQRGRLPSFSGARELSWVIIVLRVYLVAVLLCLPLSAGEWSIELLPAILLAAVLVFSTALVYELARWWVRASESTNVLQLAIVCVLVGFGYVARFAVGYMALGAPVGPTFVAAATMVWSLGVFFVSLTWLIEGASYFEWSASTRAHAQYLVDHAANSKTHLIALLRRTGARLTDKRPTRAKRRTALRDLRLIDMPRMPVLPVGLASGTWFAVLGCAGASIVGLPLSEWGVVFVAIALAGAGLAVTPVSGRWQSWKLAAAGAPVVIGYPAVFLAAGLGSVPEIVRLSVCVFCGVVPLLVFLLFARMSYEDTRAVVARVWTGLGRLLLGFYDVINGVDPRRRYSATLPT